jgi:hypothetical protein
MRTITVSSADVDVFHVAAVQYGDATLWHLIMAANNLSDPVIDGLTTLTIPAADPSQTGGVPQQG